MRLSSKSLWNSAGWVFALGFGTYIGTAIASLLFLRETILVEAAVTVMTCALILTALSAPIFAAAWLVERRERNPKPFMRVQPMEKPPGWNKDVLWWFFHGPEGRVKNDDFRDAFRERSRQPPITLTPYERFGWIMDRRTKANRLAAVARTRRWAAEFRADARKMEEEQPPGVDQLLWQAGIESFRAEADRLEQEADELERST